MSTLITNLDGQVAKSPKYKAETVAEYFRKSNLKWWKIISTQYSYKEQERAIIEWLSKMSPDNVLELGPGFGRITSILQQFHPTNLTLVEINKHAYKQLGIKFPNSQLVNENVASCTLGIKKYDLIVGVEILVHIPDIPALMRKIHAALTGGGLTIVSITPLDWYKRHIRRSLVVDRGIDHQEFAKLVRANFSIRKLHRSSNGQQLTYLLRKV